MRPSTIFLIGALAFAPGAASADECALSQAASLDIKTLADGEIAVPARFGSAEYNMVLQIGVAYSFVYDSAAKAMSLSRSPLPKGFHVKHENVEMVEGAKLPQIALGSASGKDFPVLISPEAAPEADVGGVLGMDMLHNFDIDLDFKNNKLNLFSHNPCSGRGAYWAPSSGAIPFQVDAIGHLSTTMTLDGKNVSVTLATAPGHGSMGFPLFSQLFGVAEDSTQLTVIKQMEDGPVRRYPFKSLSAGGVTIANPQIILRPDKSAAMCNGKPPPLYRTYTGMGSNTYKMCMGGSDLVIGLGILRQLHLYFAMKDRMLYVTAADAHR